MPLKDLLVHIDASKQAATRLSLAATLARRFNAHLTAIYIGDPDVIPATMADQYAPETLDAVDTRHALHREAVEALVLVRTSPERDHALDESVPPQFRTPQVGEPDQCLRLQMYQRDGARIA